MSRFISDSKEPWVAFPRNKMLTFSKRENSQIQAYLGDMVGWVPDHSNKVSIVMRCRMTFRSTTDGV